jgi:hypothetical protein
MDWTIIAICVLLAATAIGYTLVVRQRDIPPRPTDDPELKHLEARRQVLYENLKDLQFEYHQGKLSEEDYQSLKRGFLYDLAGIMDSIERRMLSKEKPAKAEGKSVAGRPAKKTQGPGAPASSNSSFCPSCKAPNQPGNRFCGKCGAAIPNS